MKRDYTLKHATRSRQIRISVVGETVVVSAPRRVSKLFVDQVVARHELWIERALAKQKHALAGLPPLGPVVAKTSFLKAVTERVGAWHAVVSAPRGARLNKVSVRQMRSRWGSCSRVGNVSINFLLSRLPVRLLDYVIIHELCHLIEHNHGRNFWSLVATYVPDWRQAKKELHRYGYLLKG